ncbi:biliverdin-producing heme oxygenase [Stenotrophomonas maltophilia]|uniref:biliverdin-producing heme oxygenase n=1 Tax=Stenotrophomonas maltophilia TaxID=40324 RepID=UPI0013DC2AAB|nr:biliverdin-producing heme oxygenase [Stenotrophomonas maltophilia]
MNTPDACGRNRSALLKAATRASHDALDKRIMAEGIFADRARFGSFLKVQYRLHCSVDALYGMPTLMALLPDLPERRRLQQVCRDLQDLGMDLPARDPDARLPGASLPEALGWMYVVEGSSLGAAVLYRMAAALGLDHQFGASHLAAHPGGVAAHWRRFTTALDAVALTPAQIDQMIDAANIAFRSVHAHVEKEFAR